MFRDDKSKTQQLLKTRSKSFSAKSDEITLEAAKEHLECINSDVDVADGFLSSLDFDELKETQQAITNNIENVNKSPEKFNELKKRISGDISHCYYLLDSTWITTFTQQVKDLQTLANWIQLAIVTPNDPATRAYNLLKQLISSDVLLIDYPKPENRINKAKFLENIIVWAKRKLLAKANLDAQPPAPQPEIKVEVPAPVNEIKTVTTVEKLREEIIVHLDGVRSFIKDLGNFGTNPYGSAFDSDPIAQLYRLIDQKHPTNLQNRRLSVFKDDGFSQCIAAMNVDCKEAGNAGLQLLKLFYALSLHNKDEAIDIAPFTKSAGNGFTDIAKWAEEGLTHVPKLNPIIDVPKEQSVELKHEESKTEPGNTEPGETALLIGRGPSSSQADPFAEVPLRPMKAPGFFQRHPNIKKGAIIGAVLFGVLAIASLFIPGVNFLAPVFAKLAITCGKIGAGAILIGSAVVGGSVIGGTSGAIKECACPTKKSNNKTSAAKQKSGPTNNAKMHAVMGTNKDNSVFHPGGRVSHSDLPEIMRPDYEEAPLNPGNSSDMGENSTPQERSRFSCC